MTEYSHDTTPEIRKLWKRDIPDITQHLLRLDTGTRHSRFGIYVKDDFIKGYAERAIDADTLVFGAFIDGQIRAIGELRGLSQAWKHGAELAVSVEPDWQGKGIGSTLFSRLVTASQNRGIKSLHVVFLNDNRRMQSIAAKHHPECHSDSGQIEARFDPAWATPMSLASEITEDASAFVRQLFRVPTQKRAGRHI
ncbi:GNAT family N-acetyltransferase [Oceaniovalibus sp. ACAM 378]|uniref:GNAT family N-acetyltransferase n=1 Tax=Oceaniovalibus sp. ACAM 378 TaxID=2599923 RepID=UPI0011D6029A|nr:GNAT family N-acetyltransferase [Oceaniovalibus sp. ACAM 378]TYB84899.1 GNAT family N-acetyltransferase [Oceaniovalibus sp. ACAM 378]